MNMNLGRLGEQLACQYLQTKGYKFVQANYRTRVGEIDLIMKDKDDLVFIEVKTRRHNNEVAPNTCLPFYKIKKLKAVIALYLETRNVIGWRTELASVTIYKNFAKIRIIVF